MKTITPPNFHDEFGLMLRDFLLPEIGGDEDRERGAVLYLCAGFTAVFREWLWHVEDMHRSREAGFAEHLVKLIAAIRRVMVKT